MAASGIRYLLHHLWELVPNARLPFQNVWYGHYIIHAPYGATEEAAQYRFLMEHGHYHDPVLVLYLLQFVVGVMASNLEAAMDSLTVAGQRRFSPKATPPAPGVAAARPAAAKETFGHRIVKWRWRWKARRQLGRMNRKAEEAKEQPLDGTWHDIPDWTRSDFHWPLSSLVRQRLPRAKNNDTRSLTLRLSDAVQRGKSFCFPPRTLWLVCLGRPM